MLKNDWPPRATSTSPHCEGIDLKQEIRRMCKEKNAIILAHYYTQGEIQDTVGFIGDSLALARKAARIDARS